MSTQFTNLFRPLWKQIAVSFFVAIYLVINFFRIGGNAFVINLNNFIVIPLALAVTLLAFMLWKHLAVGNQNRLLWSGLTIGWAMWTVSEIWWAIAALIRQELPYPSGADFFWLAGYILMYFGLWARIRSLPKVVNPAQSFGLWVTSLVSLGCTVLFIFVPIVRNSDPTAIVENILSIIYPLADLILLILVLRILFTYQQGMYGRAWVWLTLGFIFFALGDLGFAYTSTADLYYPDQQVNLWSTFGVDIPYNLSYLFVLIGLVIMQSIQRSHRAIENNHTSLSLVPNTHLLIFTRADDTVMDVSQNYGRVFPVNMVKGKTLQEVLGVSAEDSDTILKDSKANKTFKERKFPVNTLLGQEDAWVSGIAILNPQGEYSGVYLLLRMLTKDYSLGRLLTDYEKGMVSSILSKTGTKQKEEEEIKQLLVNYYLTYLQALYNRVFAEGGSIMADIFLSELQLLARQHEWQIGIQSDNLLDVRALPLPVLQEALPSLLETAKRSAIEITDEASVNTIVQDIYSKFDEFTLGNIFHFESASKTALA